MRQSQLHFFTEPLAGRISIIICSQTVTKSPPIRNNDLQIFGQQLQREGKDSDVYAFCQFLAVSNTVFMQTF